MDARPACREAGVGEPGTARAMWGPGDYHRFARATCGSSDPSSCERAGSARGPASSTWPRGRATSRSEQPSRARAWWRATSARRASAPGGEAAALGVEVEWVLADAQALPFAEGAFDAVTSCFGAMFAPDPSRGGPRGGPRLPPGRHDRDARLPADRPGGGVLRAHRAGPPAATAGHDGPAAPLGGRGPRPRP